MIVRLLLIALLTVTLLACSDGPTETARAHQDDGEHGEEDEHDEEGEPPNATTIASEVAQRYGVVTAPAAAGVIRDEHEVQGLLTTVEGRHARIVARFPGPITAVRVGVGDDVARGQTLALVESNVSLSVYAITSPLAGTVLARHASAGDLAAEGPLFEIADLSSLWVDLHLFGADAQHITPACPVVVTRLSDGVTAADDAWIACCRHRAHRWLMLVLTSLALARGWARGASRGCRSTPRPTSPTSRCRSTPRRPATRRWRPSSA
jgi:cobalt-zinc-cadmium efflux system membrane fusion protein